MVNNFQIHCNSTFIYFSSLFYYEQVIDQNNAILYLPMIGTKFEYCRHSVKFKFAFLFQVELESLRITNYFNYEFSIVSRMLYAYETVFPISIYNIV